MDFSLSCIIFGLIICTNYLEATVLVHSTEKIYANEFFTMKITPDLFLSVNPNVTSSSSSSPSSFLLQSTSNDEFRFRPSLLGKPSLCHWMNFRISEKKNFGYLYGSATEDYAGRKINIEIIALNKSSYETLRTIIPIEIAYKPAPLNKIEMKITNLNWTDLTNLKTVNNLKGIFTKELWPKSINDLSIVFMESATKLGARLPLNPDKSEGVIIHLGSNAELSTKLIELDEEVKPLHAKLTTCTFKKTRVQQLFHKFGFQLDWCAFRIVSRDDELTTSMQETTKEEASMLSQKIWNGISKDELPERNYSEEIATAVAIPSVIFAFLVAFLTIVLCFHHEKLHDEEYKKFLDELFELCKPRDKKIVETSDHPKSNEPVQMVQYSGRTSKIALKSLHDPYSDNLSLSLDSDSPSSNVFQEGSPKLNPYYRPNPPAYNVNTGKLGKFQFHEGPSTSAASIVRFQNDI